MGNSASSIVEYPSAHYVQSVIEEELRRHNGVPEWKIKAAVANENIDRENHRRREHEIYKAETEIWGMFFERCVKDNREDATKCQHALDIYTERKAYELSRFNVEKEPKLSPPLCINYDKMPYKRGEEVGDMREYAKEWP